MMNGVQPYIQIGRALLGSLDFKTSRWFYLLVIGINAIPFIAAGWRGAEMPSVLWGVTLFTLQFLWVWLAILLLSLNHPHYAKLVPHYVRALRMTAILSWLVTVLVVGWVGSWVQDGGGAFAIFTAAFLTVLLVTPFRWPVGWCVAVFSLGYFLRHDGAELLLPIIIEAEANRLVGYALVTAMLVLLGLIVARMYSPKGSAHALVFGHYLSQQMNAQDMLAASKDDFPVITKYLSSLTYWFMLPQRLYTRWLLRRNEPTPRSVYARAELSLGHVHWVLHVCMMLVFVIGVFSYASPVDYSPEAAAVFWPAVSLLLLGMVSAGLFGYHEPLLRTSTEQQLLLLLPGMPRGQALNIQLATRQMLQVLLVWLIAAVVLLFMPWNHSGMQLVAALYIGLPLVFPLGIQDWAHTSPLKLRHVIGWLIQILAAPALAYAMLNWLHMPVPLLVAIAVGAFTLFCRVQWLRMKRFPSAFPAGRWR